MQFLTETSRLMTAETDLPLCKSGLDVVGDIPWGTHLCEFYAAKSDLIDTLVPYFRAGLEANEFCMWVAPEPLSPQEAEAALREAVPELDRFIASGQIEILDYNRWYTPDGRFDGDRVLQAWSDKLDAALDRGFRGLRLSGSAFWLDQADWEVVTRYEANVDSIIGSKRMLAICTYAIEKCGLREILDVSANHQFALIRERNHWEVLQNVSRRRVEEALRECDARFRGLFSNMAEGYALYETVAGGNGEIRDFKLLDVNPAFERQTGLKRAALLGKRISEVLPGDEAHSIERYGYVAQTGQPARFESYSENLRSWYEVFAYPAAPGQLAAIFFDITERKNHDEQINLLMHEVNHRSKNLLTVVQAIAQQTAAKNSNDFVQRFSERIRALAASQDLLVKNEWKNVDLEELVCSQLAHFKDLIGTRIGLNGPPLLISAPAAQAIGMAIHELATNAGKYGALSNTGGRIEIGWSLEGNGRGKSLALFWRERGGPPVTAPSKQGFGSTVISRMAAQTLRGNVELEFPVTGLSWRLECPAEEAISRNRA